MLPIMPEVAGAAGTVCGMLLVFLGSSISGFDSFDEGAKRSVRSLYRWRAWPTLVALLCAMVSCGLALYAKLSSAELMAHLAVYFLAAGALAVAVAAVHAVWEIR